MERLTTDTPNGNFETMLNFVYEKDGWAYIRHDGEHEDVNLADWAKQQCLLRGCDEIREEGPEDIDLRLCDCMMDGPTCPISMAYCFASQAVHLRSRLKMYEDIGLGVEKIMELCNMDKRAKMADLLRLEEYQALGPINHLRELAQTEKDGRLVVLPCKVGDTVYIIRDRKIIITTVETIHQWSSEKWILNVHTDKKYRHWVGYEVSFDDFCKTVFLTREEAEAALKKREDDICTATGGPCSQCQPGPCDSRKLGEEADNETD